MCHLHGWGDVSGEAELETPNRALVNDGSTLECTIRRQARPVPKASPQLICRPARGTLYTGAEPKERR